MIRHIICKTLFQSCAGVFLLIATAIPVYAFDWGPYRGMTTQLEVAEKDIADFAKLGGNLLRIGVVKRPLIKDAPPYDFDEESFVKLDRVIEWCEKYGIKVVIDPHNIPGTEKPTTTLPSDALWQDNRYHDLLDRLWERIASRYSGHANIVGYDLLNEPSAKGLPFASGPADYNALVRRLIATIRKHDRTTPIIIEPPIGRTISGNPVNRFEGLLYLDPPPDPKVIYSPHMYLPTQFTFQGIQRNAEGIKYPGQINGRYWDKEELRRVMAPAIEWQRRHKVPIYIGEFSAIRSSGESGELYLRDLISIFEEYGWSWTYHAWREAPIWDSEIAGPSLKADQERSSQTPRVQMLRDAFLRNH